ncbi:methyltransferase [Mycolicibacterium insubricum]|jgi:SAM-dependent methyltransferase|uniref:SAM-dependent methyltransferase n=1 Tax=Mycolicibacterium insubricum TaxID=444597 RepID=A0A1X0DMG5_9MYCO|nr:class I SAM-dependent methyltransferase [Mycolicibacterium insubricum]MCB0928046.1 methyltransferase domain-containing protein [Mycobacterium sp.]MCB9442212.1 methyltransferase domain-containing protein [Mycolicibacterium sp.]ORA73601.1 SAM-dependent methyltransferase [Mycolicibacterium insubricum]BBZ68329.1 methyltransferase [Mycolicibacterium insubricum]
MTDTNALPMSDRNPAHLPGHWLLARLGKRVLRPGGRELTHRMLDAATLPGAEVVELAPGLGHTARQILTYVPAGYTGVEADEDAAKVSRDAVEGAGHVVVASAEHTGLPDASADVVVGEAMLTMQTDAHKAEIIAEAFRVLRPGGRYAIHELALTPDDVDDSVKTDVRQALARSIKVNARPLTEAEWRDLLGQAGFEVTETLFAPMALLEPKRLLSDEGLLRALKFVLNVARDSAARARVLGMRETFRTHRNNMTAISLIATKPA